MQIYNVTTKIKNTETTLGMMSESGHDVKYRKRKNPVWARVKSTAVFILIYFYYFCI